MADSPKLSDHATVIGSDCCFKGELTFEGSMKFEGKLEGKLTSKGQLAIGKSATIEADVVIGQAAIEGMLKGNVVASERIELASSAKVMADLRSPRLVVAEGATFIGSVHVSPDALKSLDKSEFVTALPPTPVTNKK